MAQKSSPCSSSIFFAIWLCLSSLTCNTIAAAITESSIPMAIKRGAAGGAALGFIIGCFSMLKPEKTSRYQRGYRDSCIQDFSIASASAFATIASSALGYLLFFNTSKTPPFFQPNLQASYIISTAAASLSLHAIMTMLFTCCHIHALFQRNDIPASAPSPKSHHSLLA